MYLLIEVKVEVIDLLRSNKLKQHLILLLPSQISGLNVFLCLFIHIAYSINVVIIYQTV